MLSSTHWVCVIVLLSAVHTGCLQGVRWVSLLMSFPKGTVSNTRILGAQVSAEQAATQRSKEEYLGWRRRNSVLFTPIPTTKAAFVECTSGRSWLGSWGHARELSAPVAAHFDVPDDIKPDAFWAAVLTYSTDLACSDALVMCQGAYTEVSQARKR